MSDRPLWRTSTRVLMHELLRREDHDAWRKLLVEMPIDMLLAEVVARGYSVQPPMVKLGGGEDGVPEMDAQFDGISKVVGEDVDEYYRRLTLGKRWPVGGGDDVG